MTVLRATPAAVVTSSAAGAAPDRPTVYAIAVLCYLAAVLTHEGLGHAGVTALLGGHVVQITSAACDCDVSALSPWAARAVYAAGCAANVVTGLLALWLGRFMHAERSAARDTARDMARYAIWLFGHVSLFVAAGYLMVFPFLPAGDWHDFVGGLPARALWQCALTLVGAAGYAATMWHAQRTLGEFLGSDPRERRERRERRVRARTLTLGPYLVGGILETLSAVVGGGGILVLISAAPATFGGTIGLPIVGRAAAVARGPASEAVPETSVAAAVPRSPTLIAIGLAAAAFELFWLGPGLIRH